MDDELGLRERKRLQTRRNIIDAATALVDQRGFDAVTIEDICERAMISRRTFFNYMDSKDEAIFGALPKGLNDDQFQALLSKPCDNLVESMLDALLRQLDETLAATCVDPEFTETIRQRRFRIANAEPTVAVMRTAQMNELNEAIKEAITAHLEYFPDDRRLPSLSLVAEATIVTALIREAFLLGNELRNHMPLRQATLTAAQHITTYSKGLTW